MFVIGGCATHNQRLLNAEGIKAITSVTNDSMMEPSGQMRTSANTPSTQGLVDGDGAYFQMGGLATILKLPYYIPSDDPNEHGVVDNMVTGSPKDIKIGTLRLTPHPAPGEPSLEIINFEASISEPLKQYVIIIESALSHLSTMSKTEAEAQVRRWEIMGAFGEDVIDFMKSYITLKFPVTVETTTPTTE